METRALLELREAVLVLGLLDLEAELEDLLGVIDRMARLSSTSGIRGASGAPPVVPG